MSITIDSDRFTAVGIKTLITKDKNTNVKNDMKCMISPTRSKMY